MKKVIIVLASVFIILACFSIYIRANVKSSCQITGLYLDSFKYNKAGNPTVYKPESIQEDYHITYNEAKKICENPDDYVEVTIDYSITNHLPFYVHFWCNAFSNMGSKIYMSKATPECGEICYIKSGESFDYGTTVIISKENLNKNILSDFKFQNLFGCYLGMYSSTSACTGFEELHGAICDNSFFQSAKDYDNIYSFYTPYNNNKTNLRLDELTGWVQTLERYNNGSYYAITVFDDKNTVRYGISLFDSSGNYKKGMLFSKLFDPGTNFNIKIGRTTYKDIAKIDHGSILFGSTKKNEFKTFHYFNDGKYLEIIYLYDGTNYIVKGTQTGNINDIFDALVSSDTADIAKNG